VAFSIRFASHLRVVPQLRACVVSVLRDIAASLEVIPVDSGYWTAVKGGTAELNLSGWRFEYTVDPTRQVIFVSSAHRVARPRLPRVR
jgi:hypothetical protein